MEYLREPTRD